MTTADRRRILEEHGLAVAPQWRQRIFWRSYAGARRFTRNLSVLGDVADGLLTEQALRAAGKLRWIEKAWHEVVPEPYVSRSRVESFLRGKLTVGVDSAVTKFYLQRLAGTGLAELLNGVLGAGVVNRVECRVRASGDGPEAPKHGNGRRRTGRA